MNNIFNTVKEASCFLKNNIENNLQAQINKYGNAHLIMPGGNTIKYFLDDLIQLEVNWHKINICLSDERCVPLSHEMSNENQLQKYFLKYIKGNTYTTLNADFGNNLTNFQPITILSMGEDGHIASLFPNEYESWKNQQGFIYYTKNQQPNRISLTEKSLLLSTKIYILIAGKEKNEFYNLIVKNIIPSSAVFKQACLVRCNTHIGEM